MAVDEYLLQIATDIGLETATFTTCLQDEIHLPRIEEDEALATELGVFGTPTIFVNGTQVSAFPAEAIIDAVLEAAGEG